MHHHCSTPTWLNRSLDVYHVKYVASHGGQDDQGAPEEGLGRSQVTVLAQQHVGHLAVLIDGAVQIALSMASH